MPVRQPAAASHSVRASGDAGFPDYFIGTGYRRAGHPDEMNRDLKALGVVAGTVARPTLLRRRVLCLSIPASQQDLRPCVANIFINVVRDLLNGCSGAKSGTDTHILKRRDILFGNDPADKNQKVIQVKAFLLSLPAQL